MLHSFLPYLDKFENLRLVLEELFCVMYEVQTAIGEIGLLGDLQVTAMSQRR